MRVSVVQADITTLAVDAIVNAANSWLAHGGGLARALRLAGGPAFVDESEAHVRRHGAVPEGSACYTGAGQLPARWVVHAVGPVWKGGCNGERDSLRRAFTNALRVADDLGARTVSMPLLSSGIFGFPRDDAAQLMMEEVCGARCAHVQHVMCVANDDETVAAMRSALARWS